MTWSAEADRLRKELSSTETEIESVNSQLQSETDANRRKELQGELNRLNYLRNQLQETYQFQAGRDARIQANTERLEEQRQEQHRLREIKKSASSEVYLEALRTSASKAGSGSPQDIAYLKEREAQGKAFAAYEPIQYKGEYVSGEERQVATYEENGKKILLYDIPKAKTTYTPGFLKQVGVEPREPRPELAEAFNKQQQEDRMNWSKEYTQMTVKPTIEEKQKMKRVENIQTLIPLNITGQIKQSSINLANKQALEEMGTAGFKRFKISKENATYNYYGGFEPEQYGKELSAEYQRQELRNNPSLKVYATYQKTEAWAKPYVAKVLTPERINWMAGATEKVAGRTYDLLTSPLNVMKFEEGSKQAITAGTMLLNRKYETNINPNDMFNAVSIGRGATTTFTRGYTTGFLTEYKERPVAAGLTTAAFFVLPGVLGATGKIADGLGLAKLATKFPIIAKGMSLTGKAVAIGLPTLYAGTVAYRVGKEPTWEEGGKRLGRITAGEIVPMGVGGYAASIVYPRVTGYMRTAGRKEVPQERVIPPDVLSGEQEFPLAPPRKHLAIFKKQEFALPGRIEKQVINGNKITWEDVRIYESPFTTLKPKAMGYHATAARLGKEFIAQKGTSELEGLYLSHGISPHFLGLDTTTNTRLYESSLLNPFGSPRVAAITPEGFKYTKAKAGVWLGKTYENVANVPSIKNEVEAILLPGTKLMKVEKPIKEKFFFKWKGVRVPIDEYVTSTGAYQFKVGLSGEIESASGSIMSYSLPKSPSVFSSGGMALSSTLSYYKKPSSSSKVPSYSSRVYSYPSYSSRYSSPISSSIVSSISSSRVSSKSSVSSSKSSSKASSSASSYSSLSSSMASSSARSSLASSYSYSSSAPPSTPPSKIISSDWFKLNNLGMKFKPSKQLPFKQPKQYRPTVFSIFTGFKGKEKKFETMSGLGLRPLRF